MNIEELKAILKTLTEGVGNTLFENEGLKAEFLARIDALDAPPESEAK